MEKISASKLLAGLVPADFIREEVQVELVTTDSRDCLLYTSDAADDMQARLHFCSVPG